MISTTKQIYQSLGAWLGQMSLLFIANTHDLSPSHLMKLHLREWWMEAL